MKHLLNVFNCVHDRKWCENKFIWSNNIFIVSKMGSKLSVFLTVIVSKMGSKLSVFQPLKNSQDSLACVVGPMM